MLDIQFFCNNSIILAVNYDTIHLLKLFDSEYSACKFKHSCEITSANFLPKKNIIAFTDLEKFFYLLDYKNNDQIITKKSFQKKAAKLLINKEESVVLLGDKTGDVYSLNLENLDNSEFDLIMGHLSMLTDMKLSHDEKFLVTSDRDEKIRISHYPNSYNIQGYLLAHKEFVIQFDFVDKLTLVSASGDSCLIVWDLESLRPIQKLELNSILGDMEIKGIDRFDYNSESQNLLVHVFKSTSLLHFKFEMDKKIFKFMQKFDLGYQIDHFISLSSNLYLMANLGDEKLILSIKKLEQNKLFDLEDNESIIKEFCSKLNSEIKFEKPLELRNNMDKNYQSYFKTIVNNMDEYFQRKQERINATIGKRKHTISNSEADTAKSKQLVQ